MNKANSLPLSFLIVGTGAVGGLVGGALAAAGERVTFIVRPDKVEAIRSNGIMITGDMGTLSVPNPQLATNISTTLANHHYDIVILAVKSFHTDSVIKHLLSARIPTPPVLCLQNGVDNETKIANALGLDHVVSGTLTTAVSNPEPGMIVVERQRGVGLASGHTLSLKLLHAFSGAGFPTLLYPNAQAMKWSKLLTNLIANATAAICDISPAEIFAHDRLFRLEITALRETLSVMQGMRIPVVQLPGPPSHWLGFALRRLPEWTYRSFLTRKLVEGRGGKPPSLHVDLTSNRGNSEVHFLNGAIVRHAKSLGLATPVNNGLSQILGNIVRGEISWDQYRAKPDRLADQLLSGHY